MQLVDFTGTAAWGHLGANQAIMTGQGKISRRGDMMAVYMNDRAFWKVVQIEVWEYCPGGYQVPKMSLSYRQSKVLGRGCPCRKSRVGWRVF